MKQSAETRPIPSAASLLRGTLTLKLLVPCIFAVSLLGAALLMESTNILSATNKQLGTALVRYIDVYISDAHSSLNSLANLEPEIGLDQLQSAIRLSQVSFPRFTRILLVDAQGVVRSASPAGFIGIDFPTLFPTGSTATMSRPMYSHETDTLTVFMRIPTASGGMIIGEIDLAGLLRHLQHFAQEMHGTTVMLTDAFGNLISHPDMALVRRQTNIGEYAVFEDIGDAGHLTSIAVTGRVEAFFRLTAHTCSNFRILNVSCI